MSCEKTPVGAMPREEMGMEPEEAERALRSLGCRGEKTKGAGEGESETAGPS